MIGGSKSFYRQEYLDDLIVFNANVLMPNYGKVWYGDLNLTRDYIVLKSIADTLDTKLYVLWEMDARFGEETKPLNDVFNKPIVVGHTVLYFSDGKADSGNFARVLEVHNEKYLQYNFLLNLQLSYHKYHLCV